MARFHLSCHTTTGVATTAEQKHGGARGSIQIVGQPEDEPGLYTVVTAGKIALPPGSLYVCMQGITGDVYAITGFTGDTIVAPAGHLIREAAGSQCFGVGGTSANRHTHLHVIAAAPATDTATDLNV